MLGEVGSVPELRGYRAGDMMPSPWETLPREAPPRKLRWNLKIPPKGKGKTWSKTSTIYKQTTHFLGFYVSFEGMYCPFHAPFSVLGEDVGTGNFKIFKFRVDHVDCETSRTEQWPWDHFLDPWGSLSGSRETSQLLAVISTVKKQLPPMWSLHPVFENQIRITGITWVLHYWTPTSDALRCPDCYLSVVHWNEASSRIWRIRHRDSCVCRMSGISTDLSM